MFWHQWPSHPMKLHENQKFNNYWILQLKPPYPTLGGYLWAPMSILRKMIKTRGICTSRLSSRTKDGHETFITPISPGHLLGIQSCTQKTKFYTGSLGTPQGSLGTSLYGGSNARPGFWAFYDLFVTSLVFGIFFGYECRKIYFILNKKDFFSMPQDMRFEFVYYSLFQ